MKIINPLDDAVLNLLKRAIPEAYEEFVKVLKEIEEWSGSARWEKPSIGGIDKNKLKKQQVVVEKMKKYAEFLIKNKTDGVKISTLAEDPVEDEDDPLSDRDLKLKRKRYNGTKS